jgi:hypothetical protein
MQEQKVYVTGGEIFKTLQMAKASWVITTSNTEENVYFEEHFSSNTWEVMQGAKQIGGIVEQPVRERAEHL